jgi:hypothetical protein
MTPAYIELVTTDTLIHNGPCILLAAHPTVLVSGQIIYLYDGLDATSGILRDKLIGSANVPAPYSYGPGAYFDRGLFVRIGTANDFCTVVWLPCDRLDLG